MTLVGFPNIGNSCYMDCILFCLFSSPNEFVNKYVFRARKTYVACEKQDVLSQLRSELLRIRSILITDSIQRVPSATCGKLKEIIKQCRSQCPVLHMYPDFSDGHQHSALEFLNFLFTIWGLNGRRSIGAIMTFRKRYGVSVKDKAMTPKRCLVRTDTRPDDPRILWHEWFSKTDRRASAIYYVPYDTFDKYNSINKYMTICTSVIDLENTRFNKCRVDVSEEVTTLSAFPDLLVLYIDRVNPRDGRMDHSERDINRTLTDAHGKKVRLDAVLVHIGDDNTSGHFICTKRDHRGHWLCYDDLSPRIIVMKTYKEMCSKWEKGVVRTHCVMLFYTRVQK